MSSRLPALPDTCDMPVGAHATVLDHLATPRR